MQIHNADDIRPYGPGKFDNVIDSLVYSASLDGCDDEIGDSSEGFGWYGLLRGGLSDITDGALTTAERVLLTGAVGAIISEDTIGFVSVEYFPTVAELDRAWAEVQSLFSDSDSDSE